MLNLDIGPFALPLAHLYLVMAIATATVVAWFAGRRRQVAVGGILTDMVLVGLLAARIGFVLMWFEVYREDWMSILDIRDGGFAAWPGLAAAIAVGAWKTRGAAAQREVLTMAVLAGAIAWFVAGGTSTADSPAGVAMPQTELVTVDGRPSTLATISAGKPAVVNLWATWCPPCRREMPVLASAQQNQPGIQFIFVNVGEDPATIERFLKAEQLELRNIVLDPMSALGRAVGSTALPTTLFYDAQGKLVDVHLGVLSAASLADKMARLGEVEG